MTRTFSPRVERPKYPKDHISIHCIQRAGRVLLMSSFGMLKDSQMSDIYLHTDVTLVDGSNLQGDDWPSVPCTLTHPQLELPHEICLGSSKYTVHSSQEFVPSRTFHIQTDCILLTISGFKKPVTYFHCGVCTSSTHCQQSGTHVPWLPVKKMGGSHVEESHGHGQSLPVGAIYARTAIDLTTAGICS